MLNPLNVPTIPPPSSLLSSCCLFLILPFDTPSAWPVSCCLDTSSVVADGFGPDDLCIRCSSGLCSCRILIGESKALSCPSIHPVVDVKWSVECANRYTWRQTMNATATRKCVLLTPLRKALSAIVEVGICPHSVRYRMYVPK